MAIKYAKYRHFSKVPPEFLRKKATEVLYEKMMFYDGKAKHLFSEIKKILSDDRAASRGDLMAQMTKYMQRANDICIDCASKLAPYQSARLQSMEVKKTTTHRFVIQAPKPSLNSSEWLEESEKPMKLIESTSHEGKLNGSSSGASPI